MKALILFLLFAPCFSTYSQEKYFKDITASQIVDVIPIVGFKAKRCANEVLSSAILQLPDSHIKQLNISTWSLCNNRQDDVFRNYNIFYKPVSRATFDRYCKELTALMICDGTYEQPR